MGEQEGLSNFMKQTPALRMAGDILGCKWSLNVLQLVQQGICRPGLMERSIEGLTTKVLNERLKKLTHYKILQRRVYPEVPPRVEYCFTPFGEKFMGVLDKFAELDVELKYQSKDARNAENLMRSS